MFLLCKCPVLTDCPVELHLMFSVVLKWRPSGTLTWKCMTVQISGSHSEFLAQYMWRRNQKVPFFKHPADSDACVSVSQSLRNVAPAPYYLMPCELVDLIHHHKNYICINVNTSLSHLDFPYPLYGTTTLPCICRHPGLLSLAPGPRFQYTSKPFLWTLSRMPLVNRRIRRL